MSNLYHDGMEVTVTDAAGVSPTAWPATRRRRMTTEGILSRVEFDTNGGCWLWTGYLTTKGYGILGDRRAHRSSYERFKGPIPPGMMICHSCDVRCCVNPAHLRAGTAKDNIGDCVRRGRKSRGEAHHHSRLTEEQVRFIRASPKSRSELAKLFNTHSTYIDEIRSGRAWAWLK